MIRQGTRSRNGLRPDRPLDVAIVGMACRFPQADDLVEFWRNILDARDCTSDVPPSRWNPDDFVHPGIPVQEQIACRRGGFLREPLMLDAAGLGVMPTAVDGSEPEQLLVLDAARAALADAGLPQGPNDGRRVDVVVGRGNYFNRGNLTRLQHGRILAQTVQLLRSLHPDWTEDEVALLRSELKASLPPFESGTIAGQITNGTAGRVADRLNLTGASYVVDAASGSALVAVELAARSLSAGRTDLALVGSVYIAVDVDFYQIFSRLGVLSRRGRARPFDAGADGLVPGEGVGVLVLKRLTDAERDGDRVYAVVKSVGVASDGRASGLAAPSARGHVRAMRRAYRQARIDPGSIRLVEAHGLGVAASDREELRALRAVFHDVPGDRRSVGAVSSLIGHAMPAAGMAGLIKAALSLHHRVLPPSAKLDRPHRLLASAGERLAWNTEARPWIHGGLETPRRAAVNAFGFAGVNTHLILEEHARSADSDRPGCMVEWDSEAILLGADDRAGVIHVARALLDWLETGTNRHVPLKDLAATLNTGQGRFTSRLGMVVSSTTDLMDRLRWVITRLSDPVCESIRDGRGTYYWSEPLAARDGGVAFVFPGEGAQYPGMLADLCPHFPEVRLAFDNADRIAVESQHTSKPSHSLFGVEDGDQTGLWSIGTAVNVILSAHWGLKILLDRLGIRPDVVVGHSSGEILALAAAGVLQSGRSLEAQLGQMATCFEQFERTGQIASARLLAVAASRERVEALLAEQPDVVVAMDNCPHQVVVAGDVDKVDRLAVRLRDEGIVSEVLPFDRAYHTPRFTSSLGPMREFYQGLGLKIPGIPVYSCATQGPMPREVEAIRALAVEQWIRPVEFAATIEQMYRDGVRVFIEVGARGNLTGCIDDILRTRRHFAVSVNVPRRSGVTQLNHLVAALYAQGLPVQADLLYARRRPQLVDLGRDRPVPRPTCQLPLGFPEMSLTPGFLERLRTSRAALTRSDASDPSQPVSLQGQTPLHIGNGRSQTAGREPQLGRLPEQSRKPGSSFSSTGQHVEGLLTEISQTTLAELPSGLSQAAALSYFETMDRFLETQRAVLDAYLRSTATSGPPIQGLAETTHLPDFSPKVNTEGVTSTSLARHSAQAGAVLEVPAPSPLIPVVVNPVRHSGRLQAHLLNLVSQRTGYPEEMLDLDYDMEADLGIDSIKRVEILGDLQNHDLVPPGIDLDQLGRCRTLREIISIADVKTDEPCHASDDSVAWPGRVEHLETGSEFVGTWPLDSETDPVAHHHTLGGRRLSAVEPGRLGLPVVPFTVMAELLAQAAAMVHPGQTVVALRNVRANRWLAYTAERSEVELRAKADPVRPDEVHVSIRPRTETHCRKGQSVDPAFEGVVVFGPSQRPAERTTLPDLATTRRCRLDAETLYSDQWLFHGPALQALVDVGMSCSEGIDGTLEVLPSEPLLPAETWPSLHTDPIILDAFTHLLGAWGIDGQAGEEGDVMFPLRVGEIALLGDQPEAGSAIACRIRVREVTRHRVRVDAELSRADGSLWVRIQAWEDWRFYWPNRFRDVFRAPDRIFVGEPMKLAGAPSDLAAVWLEPPADMARPIWRDVLEWVQLTPAERLELRGRGESEVTATHRAWGRIAAKEAARRLWANQGLPPVYPADLTIQHDDNGRPLLRTDLEAPGMTLPSLSIAHTEGVAVAIACREARVRVGVDVERVQTREASFEAAAFSADERGWLDDQTTTQADRDEWITRFWCAKEAVAKATGFGLISGPEGVLIIEADRATGQISARLNGELALRCRGMLPSTLTVQSERRGEHVWTWVAIQEIRG
ncbi:MAG: beta-ketoacyl synthase N-terminal-like domain-containing protein [Isosphaeraceae bacterium]